MVKGTTRRVILVNTPETELFEQAIFIVRDEAASRGVTARMLIDEACRAACGQPRRARVRKRESILWAAAGAAAVGLAWFLWAIL